MGNHAPALNGTDQAVPCNLAKQCLDNVHVAPLDVVALNRVQVLDVDTHCHHVAQAALVEVGRLQELHECEVMQQNGGPVRVL